SRDFIIFNSLGSIMPRNKYWVVYFFVSRLLKFQRFVIWYETATYIEQYLKKYPKWLKFNLSLLQRTPIQHIISSKAAETTVKKYFPGSDESLIYNCSKL